MISSVRNHLFENDAGANLEVRNSPEQPQIEILPTQDADSDEEFEPFVQRSTKNVLLIFPAKNAANSSVTQLF